MPTSTQLPQTKLRYRHLAEQLRGQIESGALQPGDRLPSHAESRVLYGATQSTVDRAHALLERDGLIERIHRRGTFVAAKRPPGRAGTPIIMADTYTVVAVARPDHSFFDRCVDLLYRHVEAARLSLICRPFDPVSGPLVPPPAAYRPVGFLVFSHHLAPVARQLQDAGCRVVLVGAPPADVTPGVPNVHGDHEQIGYLATRHLLDLGHRRIVFVGDDDLSRTLRWQGHQRALGEARHKVKAVDVTAETLTFRDVATWKDALAQAAAYFRRPQAPTGIVAWNDHEALEVLSVLNRAGIQVPGEVSLVGSDALPEGERARPALTTIDAAIDRQLQAALTLLTRPAPPSSSHTVVVTPTLVCRESSAPPII